MSTYWLTVKRYDVHPKAGQEVPYDERTNIGWDSRREFYPATVEGACLSVEVSEDDWEAIKAAVLERYGRKGPGREHA